MPMPFDRENVSYDRDFDVYGELDVFDAYDRERYERDYDDDDEDY